MVRILLERSKFSLETGKNLIMRDISNAVDSVFTFSFNKKFKLYNYSNL